MTVFVLAFWTPWAVAFLPGLFGCIVSYGPENPFLRLLFSSDCNFRALSLPSTPRPTFLLQWWEILRGVKKPMVLRVRSTPTRFPTTIPYATVDSTPLHPIPSVWYLRGKTRTLPLFAIIKFIFSFQVLDVKKSSTTLLMLKCRLFRPWNTSRSGVFIRRMRSSKGYTPESLTHCSLETSQNGSVLS